MHSVFTMKRLVEEAIKRDEELLHCIDECTVYTVQDLFKALQISLDCLKMYQKINDDQCKECEAMTGGKVI